jgi:glycosyltransferase involved in cell wall biosynthesis
MNVLQLSRNTPYPPQSGEEVRVWKTAEKLNELGDVWVAAPLDGRQLPDGIEPVDLSSSLLAHRFVWNALWTGLFLLGERHPLRPVLCDSIVDAVEAHTDDVAFDVVVCEMPQVADAAFELADDHHARLLMNKHNADHMVLGGFLEGWNAPGVVRRRAVGNFRSFEQWSIGKADVTVFQSEEDMDRFGVSAGPDRFVIPNGCDFEWIRDGGDPESAARECGVSLDAFTCVFLGSYDYTPNRQAASVIGERIAPRFPDAQFLLVGRDPPAVSGENVFAPGYVDDLPGTLGLADVALCPLFSGSGTKLKMLDYFAAGLPVVTTPVGAQGLDVEHERDALIHEDVDGICRGIERLQSSEELRDRLSAAGLEIGARHSWETLMEGYEDVFRALGSG